MDLKVERTVKTAALCFSGQVRLLELCYPYIKKNILDQLDSYDIFCYAQEDSNIDKISLLKPIKQEIVNSSKAVSDFKEDISELRKQNYRKIIYPESPRYNFANVYRQMYTIKGAFKLLESHMNQSKVSYKYFIRIRFDLLPIKEIELAKLSIKKGEIIIPRMIEGSKENQINDMFCITSDFDSFKDYCSICDDYRETAINLVNISPSFLQKVYFFFEKNYSYTLFYIFNLLNKKQKKILRDILGFLLLFPKLFYKSFKIEKKCNLERTFFYFLVSKKKKIRNEKIDFVIVRNLTEGLLVFG